jgi:hypothetical protein
MAFGGRYSILIQLRTYPGKGMMGGYKAFVEMTKRMGSFCCPTAVGQLTDNCQPIVRRPSVNWPPAVGQQLYTVQIYKRAHTGSIPVSNIFQVRTAVPFFLLLFSSVIPATFSCY